MNCPRRFEMVLHGKVVAKYPQTWGVDPSILQELASQADNSPLLEPELEWDPDAAPDLIIHNALLGTGEEHGLQSVAVAANCITRVGRAEEVDALATPETRIIDAHGASLLPGFVDSHMHLAVAMQRLRSADVEQVTESGQFEHAVKSFAQANPDVPVLSVFGLHYFDPPIIPAETCRHYLDRLVPDRPLLVYAHDLHTAWANTAALREADLLHEMPPYPHLVEELGLKDKVVLGQDGVPSGELREPEVYYFVSGPLQAAHPLTVEDQLRDLRTVCERLAALGLTGVHRMGLGQPTEDIAFLMLLLELEQRGELPIRVNTSISAVADRKMLQDVLAAFEARNLLARAKQGELTAYQLHEGLLELLKDIGSARSDHVRSLSASGQTGQSHPHLEKLVHLAEHIRKTTHHSYVQRQSERDNPHGGEGMNAYLQRHAKVRCDTIKIFMDGVVEKDTAYRLDRSPSPGIPEFRQSDLDVLLEAADRLGMQVAAHSIGDASVKSMLDAIGNARHVNGEADRLRGHTIPHRIEHIEMCRPEDLPRMGEQGVVASMQPLHERPPKTLWHEMVPEKKWDTAFAWQDALRNGATLVFGSDWPIVSCDACRGMHHAVTRKPWKKDGRPQAVTLEQALAAYTSGAAFTEYSSAIKGHVRPGMLADMVLLTGDVRQLASDRPADRSDLKVRMTICDGKVVYGD